MQVTILSVTIENKGKYNIADTAYKDDQGKVGGKKIFSFGAAEKAYKVLSDPSAVGKTFEVTSVKNEKGYWDWTALSPAGSAPAASTGSASGIVQGTAATVRSNYETAEERANRQVLIVKQSSLSAAVATLAVGAKAPPKTAEVLALAQEYVDFVFDKAVKEKGPTGTGFDDMADDVPF